MDREGVYVSKVKVAADGLASGPLPWLGTDINHGRQLRELPSVEEVGARSSLIASSTASTELGGRESRAVPSWTAFPRNIAVRKLISHLLERGVFSVGGIKRALDAFLVETEDHGARQSMRKPNGLFVREMFDGKLFQSGALALDPSSNPLKVEEMDKHHVRSCGECRDGGVVLESCYFSAMRRCIVNGWRPPLDGPITQVYATDGNNYPSVSLFDASFRKEWAKMKTHGVAQPLASLEVDFPSEHPCGIISPMGAALKNSDKVKAEALAGIKVTDQRSMSQANIFMTARGFPEFKARVTHDLTATGVNGAAYCPSFRYPSLHEFVRIVSRDCWLGKSDVSRYFHSFPIAREAWWMFIVRYLSVMFVLVRCCFGFAPCPYYCSTWSAEYRSWVLARGVPCSHMMDDWGTSGLSEAAVIENLDVIDETLESVGHAMARDKRDIGQALVFLGILINTCKMTLSFDATQAKGMWDQLSSSLAILKAGRDLDMGTIRHTAGRLGWYAEVLQSGRCRTKGWWGYTRFWKQLRPVNRAGLIKDTEWWLEKIRVWADGGLSGVEYPILTADETLRAPHTIYIVQSDASGGDGFGFVEGFLEDENPGYVSRQWGDGYSFFTSHNGELQAFLFWIRTTSIRSKLVLWVTDCLSAVWSVNKGGCHEDAGFETLSFVLEEAERQRDEWPVHWHSYPTTRRLHKQIRKIISI